MRRCLSFVDRWLFGAGILSLMSFAASAQAPNGPLPAYADLPDWSGVWQMIGQNTFDNASAPERHHEQYFEMNGNRAFYKDGWMACTTPLA